MLSLSTNQAKIVHSPLNHTIQVCVSAGSGKTRVLTERVRFILENTQKEGVIALTFTNKAADELTARLMDCEHTEDRAWIATIHSVAQRILERYGHTIGLPTDLHIYDRDKDRMEVFMQSLRDEGIDIDEYLQTSESKSQVKNLQSYMTIFSSIKRELLTEQNIAEQYPNHTIWKIFQDYQNVLLNSGGIDYDDILVYARKIILTHNWIATIYRAQYKHICVDEAQDLNKAQYEFIKSLCGDVLTSVLMVGDPNQMIYGFNGSSKDYLCTHFLHDFKPKRYTLKENYRSTKAIIQAANQLKPDSQTKNAYALAGRFHVLPFESEEAEADWIITQVNELIALKTHDEIEGDISLNKMVVIARNRFVFNVLKTSLKEKEIPFCLSKSEQPLEPSTTFGQVLDYSIRLKLNSKDWIDRKKLHKVLNISEPNNPSMDTLSSLAKKVGTSKINDAKLLEKLISIIDTLETESPNIPKLVRDVKHDLETLILKNDNAKNGKQEDIKLSLEELDEFSRTWTIFKRKGLGESLSEFSHALALGQLSEHNQKNGLTLSTVHTMKGLEKDIVFLIGMCEGVFPDYRSQSKAKLDEERNSAFVAITRAKRWLYVTYPEQRMMPWGDSQSQKKSRFIKEMEQPNN